MRETAALLAIWVCSLQGSHNTAAQQLGDKVFKLESCAEGADIETSVAIRLDAGCFLMSALRIEGPEPKFRVPYSRVKGDGFDFFIGRAELGQGRALRKSLAAQVPADPGSLWSADAESAAACLLAGFRSGELSVFSIFDSDSIVDLGKIGPAFEVPVLSFKAAALEFEAKRGDFSWAFGSGAALGQEKESPDGWKSGASPREPALQALSAAASAVFAAKGLSVGLWSGLSLGSLIPPGWAGSLEYRMTCGGRGNDDSGGKSRDGERYVLDSSSPSPGLSFDLKAFACSASYRNYLLEKPSTDRALKAGISLKLGGFALRASLTSSSPRLDGGGTGCRLMKDDVISSSFWRWRTEALSGGFGLAWGLWDVSARVKVDREGIAACDLWLRYEGRTTAGTEPRLKAAAQLYLLDTESVEDEDVESGVFDIDESDWNDGESVGLSRIAASAGSLAFKRLKLGAGLAWGKSANRGRADLSLNVSANDDGLGLTIAGEFFQSLGIGSRSVLGLSLASPSGGYDLDRPPDAFPNIGLDFTVSEGMKTGG